MVWLTDNTQSTWELQERFGFVFSSEEISLHCRKVCSFQLGLGFLLLALVSEGDPQRDDDTQDHCPLSPPTCPRGLEQGQRPAGHDPCHADASSPGSPAQTPRPSSTNQALPLSGLWRLQQAPPALIRGLLSPNCTPASLNLTLHLRASTGDVAGPGEDSQNPQGTARSLVEDEPRSLLRGRGEETLRCLTDRRRKISSSQRFDFYNE